MVQRGLNWAATTLVGVFGFVWIGVVVFATVDAPTWARVGQVSFGACLIGWALYKAAQLLRRTEPRFIPRHRRVRA
jgi:hypothetical protein